MNIFQKASRTQKFARIFLRGTSGSGKTFSALVLAKELAKGDPIAVIDTEKNSSTHYSNLVDFDVVDFTKLFDDHNPLNYISLIDEVEKQGYKVLILDSFSHVWIGNGGILDLNLKIAKTKFRDNSFRAWQETNKKYYDPLIKKVIIENDLHIIATGRTKTEYEVSKDENNRTSIKKLGSKTQQREGVEYEFDTILDLQHGENGLAVADKDRTQIFAQEGEQITRELGKRFEKYFAVAKKPPTIKKVSKQIEAVKTIEDLRRLYLLNSHLHENKNFKSLLKKKTKQLQE